MLPELSRILEAVEKAQTDWTGWDWSNTFLDIDGNPYYLDSENDITDDMPREVREEAEMYGRKVEEDAKQAILHGDKAIQFLEKNDLDKALESLESASGIEQNWGSDPIWGSPRKKLEDLLEDLELRLDDVMDTVNLEMGDEIEHELVDNNTVEILGKSVNLLLLVEHLESEAVEDLDSFTTLIDNL